MFDFQIPNNKNYRYKETGNHFMNYLQLIRIEIIYFLNVFFLDSVLIYENKKNFLFVSVLCKIEPANSQSIMNGPFY